MIRLINQYNYSDIYFSDSKDLFKIRNKRRTWIGHVHENTLKILFEIDSYEYELVGGDTKGIILQSDWTTRRKSESNRIKICDTNLENCILQFNTPIVIRDYLGNNDYLGYKMKDEQEMVSFNPYTRETAWAIVPEGVLQTPVHLSDEKIIFITDKTIINCYNTQGCFQWRLDTKPYFLPDTEKKEAKVFHSIVNNLLLIYLSCSKLMAINATTGQFVWEIDFPGGVFGLQFEEKSGMIYAQRRVIPDREEIFYYQIINGQNGKTELIHDNLTDFLLDKLGDTSLSSGAMLGDYIYFHHYKSIFKINKTDGTIVETYTQDKLYFSPEVTIHNNLIYICGESKEENKILVFQVE